MLMNNVIEEKSFHFAVRIVKLCKYLREERKEYILSKQLMRSGTSIGANLAESDCAISRRDFLAKIYIALKECSETEGWLSLLLNTNCIDEETYKRQRNLCGRIRRMLIASCKTLKENAK